MEPTRLFELLDEHAPANYLYFPEDEGYFSGRYRTVDGIFQFDLICK